MALSTRLAESISCHAWNGDGTKVALCPNNSEIHIYKKEGNGFVREVVLKEHDKIVTGLDWGAKTNRLVSCGQDRNAYVWKNIDGNWKPTLVILRLNRAATKVKWSPNEDKFAVASGAKLVSVCYFEEDNDWWVSKHIKKHKSTVLDLAWHPNNILLATASTDYKCRVFSGFVRNLDKKPGETAFGSRLPFGELLQEYPAAGWVKAVDWNVDGTALAYASHDCSVTIIDLTNGAPGDVQVVRHTTLPYETMQFVNNTTIVCAGHDCFPREIKNEGGTWTLGRNFDEKKADAGPKQTGTRAAFAMFQNKVDRGESATATKLQTKHQNTITMVRGVPPGSTGSWSSFSTSGLDGKFSVWQV